MTTETGLTIREQSMPATFQDVKSMAEVFAKSGMFQDAKELYSAIVKVQAGRELGLPPVYSMQNINMIQGKLGTSANTIALLIKTSGKYNYRITAHDEQKCSIAFYELEAGKMVEVGTSTFTMKDAERAQLVKPGSGWAKYPRAMLFSRAISQGGRLYCPDAIGGAYTSEELQAIPDTEKPTTSHVANDTPPEVVSEGDYTPVPETTPVDEKTESPEPLCTEAQRKKIFAASKEQGLDNQYIKDYMFDNWQVDSTTRLTKKQASELIEAIETGNMTRPES